MERYNLLNVVATMFTPDVYYAMDGFINWSTDDLKRLIAYHNAV